MIKYCVVDLEFDRAFVRPQASALRPAPSDSSCTTYIVDANLSMCSLSLYNLFEAAGALAPEQLRKVTDNFETTKFFGEFLTKFCFLAANQLPGFIVLTLPQAPPGRLVS